MTRTPQGVNQHPLRLEAASRTLLARKSRADDIGNFPAIDGMIAAKVAPRSLIYSHRKPDRDADV